MYGRQCSSSTMPPLKLNAPPSHLHIYRPPHPTPELPVLAAQQDGRREHAHELIPEEAPDVNDDAIGRDADLRVKRKDSKLEVWGMYRYDFWGGMTSSGNEDAIGRDAGLRACKRRKRKFGSLVGCTYGNTEQACCCTVPTCVQTPLLLTCKLRIDGWRRTYRCRAAAVQPHRACVHACLPAPSYHKYPIP